MGLEGEPTTLPRPDSRASGSVVTSLAGFAGRRPQLPGGRMGIPAALKYALAVSRRTPVVCSIRRSGHPSRPNATTCSLFSVLKTLLMPTEPVSASRRCQCPGLILCSLAGFQVTTIGRFWVTAEAEKAPWPQYRCHEYAVYLPHSTLVIVSFST